MKLKKIWSAWDKTRQEFFNVDMSLTSSSDETTSFGHSIMCEATTTMSVLGFRFHEIFFKKASFM